MKVRAMFRRIRRAARWGLGLWLVLAAGCATLPEDNGESELPWSKPQPWEGVVPMPGLETR